MKWKDRDKKLLFERVREKYLLLVKLRLNVQFVNPMVKIMKKQEKLLKRRETEMRKIERRRNEKLIQKDARALAKKALLREGLRSRSSIIGPAGEFGSAAAAEALAMPADLTNG